MKQLLFLFFLIASIAAAQDVNENTNTFFDDSETVEYKLSSIFIKGEVEKSGEVDLNLLPLHSSPVKVLQLKDDGKYKFKGSFFYKGYSLHDIVSQKKIKKANEEEFRPPVDIYLVVENNKGDKSVISWGELFYSKDNFKIILSQSITGINPSKMPMKWPIPENPSIVCANDFSNVRFIENPSSIEVKTAIGDYEVDRKDDIFSPEIKIIAGERTEIITDIDTEFTTRSLTHIDYGHGRGYKGISEYEGYLLKDVIGSKIKLSDEYLKRGIAVVSAKDGYRVVFSISEIMNRNDMNDFLLIDNGDSSSRGRYTLLCIPDFFVDRNVRSVEKIEILLVD